VTATTVNLLAVEDLVLVEEKPQFFAWNVSFVHIDQAYRDGTTHVGTHLSLDLWLYGGNRRGSAGVEMM